MVGLGDGAGKHPVPGCPTALAYGRAGACYACCLYDFEIACFCLLIVCI